MERMDRSLDRWPVNEGDAVVAADGQPVGTVVGFYPDCLDASHVVVEQLGFFAPDYFVPIDAICRCGRGRVHLGVSKDEVRRQGWGAPPNGFAGIEDVAYPS